MNQADISAITSHDTVLITGGTGFTGSHLVKTLCETGATVRVIARASSNRDDFDGLKIEWFIGEVYDAQLIKQATANVNYIFHVAAAYREAKINDEVYWKVHVQSTQLLAQAALEAPNFKRFIHTSTVGVHGHIDQPPADEECRFAPGDEYQNTKVEGEVWIRKFAKDHGLAMTIIRPAAIYGPGDRRLLKVFKLAKLKICPILGLSLIHI